MKTTNAIALIVISAVMNSCSQNDKSTENTQSDSLTTNTETVADSTITNPAIQPISTDNNISAQPVEVQANPSTANPSTAEGMNPAHGQPGHRCDIAVGAPLNSPPGKPDEISMPAPSTPVMNVPAPQVQQVTPPPSPTPSAGPTPPGMNPPHGQPGHDCSIAVGAPLKK